MLQNNQDLCSRLGSLESLYGNQRIRSAASIEEDNDSDTASTIRPRRHASESTLEPAEASNISIKRFTFEQDLRTSWVYKRAMRRESCESLWSSSAPSFGWSCLSETSLADISNISVISLPIVANELSNGIHYVSSWTTKPIPQRAKQMAGLGRDVTLIPTAHTQERFPSVDRSSAHKLCVLGNSLSGKSTICRQIQALGGGKLSDDVREAVREVVLDNLASASLLLYFRVGVSGIELSDQSHNVR